MIASAIPRHDENPVERRRVLNILAQRRYRRRKRARLLELEAQLQTEETDCESTSLHLDDNQSDTVNASTSQSTSILAPVGAEAQFETEVLDQPVALSDNDSFVHADFNRDLNIHEENQLDLLPISGNASYWTWIPGQSIENFFTSSNNHLNLPDCSHHGVGPIQEEAALSYSGNLVNISTLAQYKPSAVTDFADYAITTPGLNVIRAHVEIFHHMHGSNFDLDIFNPQAISPVSRGFAINPSPPNFRPTPLQRQVQHHPIIDVLPWPSFRDRFLYIMSLPTKLRPEIARGDMASVTLELMFAVKDAGGGIRVWGSNPFSLENWEIGPVFYSKFWWAIDADIVKNSNKLRAQRGENPLRFSVSDAL